MYTQLDTRLAVAKSLSRLLKKRPMEKISVVELCREAEISRTTFYQYFQDIYAVAEWLWDYTCKEILEKTGLDYGWNEGHRKMLDFMLENKDCFLYTENNRHNNSFLEDANDRSLKIHKRNIENKLGRQLSDEEQMELNYVSYCYASITHKWISDGMTVSPVFLEELFDRLTPEFIVNNVGR